MYNSVFVCLLHLQSTSTLTQLWNMYSSKCPVYYKVLWWSSKVPSIPGYSELFSRAYKTV